jgi:uncharacterized membrane protein
VIHRTFRSLDDPPKLLGFSLHQWAALVAGASALLALSYATQLPAKAAITLFVFAIGLPAALTYVSDSGGLQLGVLLRDAWRWRASAHTLQPASPQSRPHPPGLLVAGPPASALFDAAGEASERMERPA